MDERKTGVRFAAALQAVTEGGRVRTDGDALVVEDATAVTLVLTAATDVKHPSPVDAADRHARGGGREAVRSVARRSRRGLPEVLRASLALVR